MIQGLWVGDSLSSMEQLCIRSFLACGHEFHLYAYGPIGNVPDGTLVMDANRVLPRDRAELMTRDPDQRYVTFSNLFRYQLLLDRGGWWVDLDVICLRRFDFEQQYVFTSEYDDVGQPARPSTAVIKVPAGEPFIRESLEIAQAASGRVLSFGQIGFRLFREMLRKHRLEKYALAPEAFAPVSWWQVGELVDPEAAFPDLSGSYAIHMYNAQWRRDGIDKSRRYDRRSVYGYLQERYAGH